MVGPLLARFRIHSRSQTGTKTSIGPSVVPVVFGDGLKCLKEFEVIEVGLQVLADVKVEIFTLVS